MKKRKCITCGEPMDPVLDQVPMLEHPVCEADRLAKKSKPVDYF